MEFNIYSFPLEQIGWGLRQLSLSGAIGNMVAIMIYLLVGSIPVGAFLIMKKKRMIYKIDYMLIALSMLLLVVLYYMINPGLLSGTMAESGKLLLSGTFYSALVGYIVLRMIGSNHKGTDLITLQKTIRVLLYLVMILLVCSVFVECFVNLPANLLAVKEGNSVSDGIGELFYGAPDLTMTNIFLTLQAVVNALPYGLSVVIVFCCIKALEELLLDSYSEKAISRVRKITRLCRISLVAVVLSGVLFNLVQLLFSQWIHQMNITIDIPIFSILFILVIHMLAKYIEENQKLKEDNSLFI